MKKIVLYLLCMNSFFLFSQRVTFLKTENEKVSYALGVNLANHFGAQGFDKFNLNYLVQGMKDRFESKELLYPEDLLQGFITDYMIAYSRKEEEKELKKKSDKAAYAVGVRLAEDFKPQGFEHILNLDLFMQGMRDKFKSIDLVLDEDDIKYVLEEYTSKHIERMAKINLEASQTFLKENKENPGVKVTSSGLQYKVIQEGKGTKPSDTDVVTVNNVLKMIDGFVIEDSKKTAGNKPVDFPLSNVVSGWMEGVKLMSKGAKYILYIPAELAYGENGPAGPNQALVFEVELIDFKPSVKK